jgi:O-antigen ligase
LLYLKKIFIGNKQLHQFWLHGLLLMAFGVVALTLQEPLLIAVPFIIVLLPKIVQYIITQTHQLFWLLLLLLPLSTEINITPSLGLDFPDELIMMLLTGLFLVQLIHQPRSFPIHVLKHPIFLIIVLQLCWMLVCTYYSQNSVLSLKFFLAKIWYIVPFVVLPQYYIQQQSEFKKIALLLLLPMSLVVIQCLIRHALFNFSFEGIKQTLSPFFRNHVNYSAMLVCLMPIIWYMKKLTSNNHKYYKWLTIGLIVGLVALFFAYSRGAWVALILGILTAFIIYKKWMLKVMMMATIIIALLIGWLASNQHYVQFAPNYEQTIFHSNLGEHLSSTTSLKDLSNAERFYRWVAGAKMFAAKPITGFGPNTFYDYYKNYAVDVFKTYVSNNPEHSSVHNYFLLMALEQGFIGLLLFCILLFSVLMYAQQLYHQLQHQLYKTVAIAIGVIIAMIATINMMSDMIETDKIGGLFWLCVGVLIVLSKELKIEQERIA